ncbi:hypothetical protein FG386_000376 [Cryptosporidium ryanae]|uniref:uncharacterized protein n=1 Tax=Cryptosporidium ryanae TaxID=515981 RepID=UPI00351A7F0F|nr:hypothetical protein FG386_000376 [Cryptosporidium ryanae]
MITKKAPARIETIEGIWKDSYETLSENEVSLIHRSLKVMLSEANEIREVKKASLLLSEKDFLFLVNQFENPITDFVSCFDFERIQNLSFRRNIAKYSYHILTCILNIIEKSKICDVSQTSLHLVKDKLYKSCQICLNYYFPSKAIKSLESCTFIDESVSSPTLYKKKDKTKTGDFNNYQNSHLLETPPKTSSKVGLYCNLPNPSPFHTAIGSPSNAQIEFKNDSNTRYNSYENLSVEFEGNKKDNTNNFNNNFLCDSEFFPREFQHPLPIEETKRRLKEKLMKKEANNLNKKIQFIKEINNVPNSTLNDKLQLCSSWGSENSGDNSDLQVEDLVSPCNGILKIKQKIQNVNDNMECTRIASELAETLTEPNRTKRIKKEIYQQSIERSIELVKSLGICYNLKPNILSKKMFHTIEQITDYF